MTDPTTTVNEPPAAVEQAEAYLAWCHGEYRRAVDAYSRALAEGAGPGAALRAIAAYQTTLAQGRRRHHDKDVAS